MTSRRESSSPKPEFRFASGSPPLLGWFFFVGYLIVGGVLLIPLNVVLNRHDASELWWVTVFPAAIIVGLLVQDENMLTPGELEQLLRR